MNIEEKAKQNEDTQTESAKPHRAAKRILLALRAGEFPAGSLMHAMDLCQTLNADLHVVRVLPYASMASQALRPLAYDDAARAVDEMRGERAAVMRWLEEVTGRPEAPERVEVCRGDFVSSVLEQLEQIEPALLVIAPRSERFHSSAEQLADRGGVPILVARWSARRGTTIVAATDLRESDFPVVRSAAELATALTASVVPLHNVSPLSAIVSRILRQPNALRDPKAVLRERDNQQRQGLARAREQLALEHRGVVSREDAAMDAILQEATQRRADVVVVGLRARSWLERSFGTSVAAQVVKHAQGSVLVTPLTARRAPLA